MWFEEHGRAAIFVVEPECGPVVSPHLAKMAL